MDINTETCAKIREKKHKFNTKRQRKDGFILKIHHTLPNKTKSNKIRFLHASLNHNGTLLSASNHSGDVFVVDFNIEKCWFLDTILSISVIKFVPRNERVFLVGEYSGTLSLMNCDSGLTGIHLKGHKYAVTDVSFSGDDKCITTTGIDAIVWDLAEFKMLQMLQTEEGNTIKQAIFIPMSNFILACFQDDIIQIWNSDTFQPVKQILPITSSKMQIKSIAFTQNGKIMVIGGHSNKLIIFTTETCTVFNTVTLPANIQSVKKMEFVPNAFDGGANKILAILSSHGEVLFYDMETETVINKLSTDSEILKFSISQGRYIACVLNTGEVNLYKLLTYTSVPNKFKEKCVIVNKSRKVDVPKVNKFQVKESLDIDKLKNILQEFGEYPDLYRRTIWGCLLGLPNDKEQYDRIITKTFDSPFSNVEQTYPMVNKQDLRNLKRALKNIVSWCPFFAEVAYLPIFVFPFVRFFQNEPVLAFEALIVIIVNYCQYWFEYHPLPPINILGIIENILIAREPALMTHFNSANVNSTTYAWPLLQSAFSEILPKTEWLILWDHILSNEPSFLLISVVAYNIINRNTLLGLKKKEDFEVFFHNQNTFDFKKFLAKVYGLLGGIGMGQHPRQYLDVFRKPKRGFYPVFNDFPKVHLKGARSEMEGRRSGSNEGNDVEVEVIEPAEKENEESLRLSELKRLYQDKINQEHQHVLNRRAHLQQMCAKLKSDESDAFKVSSRSFHKDQNQQMIKEIYKNKKHTGAKVKEIEEELLEHYTVLLKHKLEIEKLTGRGDNSDYLQLKNDYNEISKEIKKAKTLANDTRFLKKLNITTSLDAVNKLIDQVESHLEIQGNQESPTKVNNLMVETRELSEDLGKLINLITKIK